MAEKKDEDVTRPRPGATILPFRVLAKLPPQQRRQLAQVIHEAKQSYQPDSDPTADDGER